MESLTGFKQQDQANSQLVVADRLYHNHQKRETSIDLRRLRDGFCRDLYFDDVLWFC
jgi:hypothetical protein